MEAFLKNGRRGKHSKKYLGVIGSYLVEILDDNPLIPRVLAKSTFLYQPSNADRLSGPNRRMILKTFTDDAIVILVTSESKLVGLPGLPAKGVGLGGFDKFDKIRYTVVPTAAIPAIFKAIGILGFIVNRFVSTKSFLSFEFVKRSL